MNRDLDRQLSVLPRPTRCSVETALEDMRDTAPGDPMSLAIKTSLLSPEIDRKVSLEVEGLPNIATQKTTGLFNWFHHPVSSQQSAYESK